MPLSTIYLLPSQELWNQQAPSKACDVYSMGMVFFEIATREVPFDSLDPPVIRERVLAGQRPSLPAACPAPVRSLIERCWAQMPGSRPTAAQVLKETSAW